MRSLLTIVFSLSMMVGLSQQVSVKRLTHDQVPANVRDAFRRNFEGVEVIQWEQHSFKESTIKYVAIFDHDGIRKRARYRSGGEGITTSSYFLFNRLDQLPAGVRDHAGINYPNYRMGSAEKITSLRSGQIVYRVRLRSGAELLVLYLDEKGNKLEKSSLPPELTEEDTENN